MAYERLNWPMVAQSLSGVLAMISYQCCDIRELLIVRGPDASLSVATLLAVLTDGAANLLHPGQMEPGDRFRSFLNDNYPWKDDQPFGIDRKDALDLMWEIVRTPAIHRIGFQHDAMFKVKFVVLFTPTDERMAQIETDHERPFSEPTIKFDGTTLTIHLESWYWGIRKAITNAVDTKDKVDAIAAHLESGDFARTNSLYKLLKANIPRPKKKSQPKPKS